MVYIITIAFTLSFVFYSKFQFEEREGKSKGKWHIYGWYMRVLAFVPFITPHFKIERPIFDDVVLSVGINVLLWELLINKIALRVNWFHIGTQSHFDVTLGKKKWYLCFGLLAATIVYKIAYQLIV